MAKFKINEGRDDAREVSAESFESKEEFIDFFAAADSNDWNPGPIAFRIRASEVFTVERVEE